MPTKRKLRIAQVTNEYEETVEDNINKEVAASKLDSELFVVDRSGSNSLRRKIQKVEDSTNVMNKKIISQTERNLIKKKLSQNTVTKKVVPGNSKSAKKVVDLWGDDDSLAITTTTSNSNSAVDTISSGISSHTRSKSYNKIPISKTLLPGQSYNPSFSDHQDAVAEALAIELKRQEEEEKNNNKQLYHYPNLQQAIADSLIPDNVSDESDEEDDDSNNEDDTKKVKRQKEKKTKAQRNKQRARKENEKMLKQQQHQKMLLKEIEKVPVIMKQLTAQEKELQAKKEVKKQLKAENEKTINTLTKSKSGSNVVVPLSDELHGSLRQLIPKGQPLIERVSHLREQGDLMKTDRRNRQAYEKPHAGKNIKWYAKYKYTTR